MKADLVSISDVKTAHQSRFKPLSYLHEGQIILRRLQSANAFNGILKDYVSNIFRPGIFKRNFINNLEKGLPYIPAAAMMMANPYPASKILSIRFTDNLSSMILHKGMSLISCAGTIGKVRLIEKNIDGAVGSQDIIRVVAKENYGFIYAYLSSSFVYNYLLSKAYGSVVARLEPSTVEQIPVVNIPIDIRKFINNLILEATTLREEAADELDKADKLLKEKAGLRSLTPADFDYFGQHNAERKPSCFMRRSSELLTSSLRHPKRRDR